MKSIYLKIVINIELFRSDNNHDILSAKSNKQFNHNVTVPDFLSNVGNAVDEIVRQKGFNAVIDMMGRISVKNGGFSTYNRYILDEGDLTINLILDVRLSDHPSKPNLSKRSQIRVSNIALEYPEIEKGEASAEVLDIYCKEYNWGLQIFVGSNDEYSKPVTSISDLERILNGKLDKLIAKYS